MKLVRVPLRISFIGGGSDIPEYYEKYGGAVVSSTINKYIYLTSNPQSGLFPHKYRLVYSQVEECNELSEIKHPIIREVFKQYQVQGVDLDVISDVPSGTGLGSSSAFTVGMHYLFSRKPFWATKDIAESACNTEINILKEPIGKQDQYAAAFGGISCFEFTPTGVKYSYLGAYSPSVFLFDNLLLFYLGGKRRASNILTSQSKDPAILKEMVDLALCAKHQLKIGSYKSLGVIIRQGWELKKKLSPHISNDRVDAIINEALKAGADGCKLLGAGETGFVLVFCEFEKQELVHKALAKFSIKHVPIQYEPEGCEVLYDDQE